MKERTALLLFLVHSFNSLVSTPPPSEHPEASVMAPLHTLLAGGGPHSRAGAAASGPSHLELPPSCE